MEAVKDRNEYFAAINTGKPLKSYIKTILGKVFVNVWGVYERAPIGMILEGDPKKREEGSIYDIWSEEEDVYFKRANKRHFQLGTIIEFKREDKEPERTIEQYTDEELKDIINKPFFSLQAVLNSTDSLAVLFRIQGLAQDLEKSEKVMRAINSRLSEIQNSDAQTPVETVEE